MAALKVLPNFKTLGTGAAMQRPVRARQLDATERLLNQAFLGRLAPYLERDCLRSLTPCKSSEPRTMW